MSENWYTSPLQGTSITNRFLSLFDHFTAYYNCMTWNVRKLISPPFQCTRITNRVLRLFDRFTAYYNMYDLKCQKTHYSAPFSAQVSQIVFLADLTILRLITTVWPEMSENSLSPAISVHKYHKSCSSFIWPFYGLLQLYDLKCQKSHISATSVHNLQISFSKLIWPFYG